MVSRELLLNTNKTKELFVTNRGGKPMCQPIEGQAVMMVGSFKYLGMILDQLKF